MTNAKICGLSTPETLAAAIAGGASHVGFVFFPPSPRNVTPDQAAALAAQVPGHVAKVGVFVDPDDALLDAAIAAARLDGTQLHKAPPPRPPAIRARPRPQIWTAIPVNTRADTPAGPRPPHAPHRRHADPQTPPTHTAPS